MENLILEEICKNLNDYDKIIVKLFSNIFLHVYHQMRIDLINKMLNR